MATPFRVTRRVEFHETDMAGIVHFSNFFRYMEFAEVEFLRWRAERWMKVRHMPGVLRHYPGFVLRHGPEMLAHTFRGSTWRSALGLESEREVFRRYKARRVAEREYVPAIGI